MWDKIKEIISPLAPVLGGMIGGPAGATAGLALKQALLGDKSASDEQLLNTVTHLNPENQLALKQADYDYQLNMARIDAQERDSARNRELGLAQAGVVDKTPARIAFSFIGGYFTLAVIILIAICTQQVSSEEMQPIVQLLKDLGYAVMLVLSYYFGASNNQKK